MVFLVESIGQSLTTINLILLIKKIDETMNESRSLVEPEYHCEFLLLYDFLL